MKKHYLPTQIYTFLLLFVGIMACNGQVKSNLPKNKVHQQPKMIGTQGIVSGNVVCELQDRAGNLWFSTSGEGVYRFDGKSFTNFTTKDGLSSNEVSAIIEDKAGNILFGTNSGICKYDGGKFSKYFKSDSLTKFGITSLLEDREGNIWFGVINKGIYRYDGTNVSNFLYKYEHPFYGDRHEKYISDIIQDKNGNIWFSSWNGGGVWRYDGKAFKSFLPSANYYKTNQDKRNHNYPQSTSEYLSSTFYSPSKDHITDDMIFSATEDKAGNIWFATRRHGACLYDGKYFKDFKENEVFVSRGLYSILEDKEGNMWFTTNDNGVWCYNGKSFKNFTTKDGLINDSVKSILEDKNGNIWFGTRGFGLSRYDGKKFTNFSE